MNTQKMLLDMTNDVRGWLQHWGKDFTDGERDARGPADLNPIAWQLGHIAAVQDSVYGLYAGQESIVPEDVQALSGPGGPPPPPDATYRPLSDLWELLERTQTRLTGLIGRSGDADFDRASEPENRFFHHFGQSVFEAALHENYHVGMIGALRKTLGKGPPA